MHIVLSSPVGTGCLAPNWYHDVITDLRHFFVRTGRRERVCDQSESSMVNVRKVGVERKGSTIDQSWRS